ncbi:MAG: Dyp-type peroxidase, partial [Synechocystis sp.]
VSQPAFLQKQLEGSTSKYWKHPGAPLKLVLIDDPNGTKDVSFGSFLVFRKLEQNVKGFKTAEAELAKKLKLPTELAGAMAVGRYEDGTPLVLQPGDQGWAESDNPKIPNDFNYDSDPDGLKCPFHAHVRKSNPRLESVGSFAKDADQELGHRIARRGITYGGPLSATDDLHDLPEKGVGLLFMCYQSDIWEQFEFIQRLWCNNPLFLKPGSDFPPGSAIPPEIPRTGLDAVIGQKQGDQFDPVIGEVPQSPQNWPEEWGKATTPITEPENQFGQFVTLKGGEYFFSPSLTFLRNLPSLTFPVQEEMPPLEEETAPGETT